MSDQSEEFEHLPPLERDDIVPAVPGSSALAPVDILPRPGANGERGAIRLVDRAVNEGFGIPPAVKRQIADLVARQAIEHLEAGAPIGLAYAETVRKMDVDDQARLALADKRDRLNDESPTEIVGDRVFKVEKF